MFGLQAVGLAAVLDEHFFGAHRVVHGSVPVRHRHESHAAQELDLPRAELVESGVMSDAHVSGPKDHVGAKDRVALDGGQAADG